MFIGFNLVLIGIFLPNNESKNEKIENQVIFGGFNC
jgi:uncharacterized membrane protein